MTGWKDRGMKREKKWRGTNKKQEKARQREGARWKQRISKEGAKRDSTGDVKIKTDNKIKKYQRRLK